MADSRPSGRNARIRIICGKYEFLSVLSLAANTARLEYRYDFDSFGGFAINGLEWAAEKYRWGICIFVGTGSRDKRRVSRIHFCFLELLRARDQGVAMGAWGVQLRNVDFYRYWRLW